MTYRVTAPYVTLQVDTPQGRVVLGYHKDALVPEGVNADDLARHIRKGMVEKLESDEERELKRQKAEDEKAAEQADKGDDKADAATIKQAEDDKAKADKAAAKEDADAKAAGRVPVKAADSKPGAKTAASG